jgi:hypothetical protein
MSLALRFTDGQQPDRLRYAARLLLDSAGIDAPLPVIPAASPQTAGLASNEEVLVSARELETVFAATTLQQEVATGRHDTMGMFDEAAVAWEVTRPWVDLRAKKLAASLGNSGAATPPGGGQFRVILTHDIDRSNYFEPTSLVKSVLHQFGLYPHWIPLATAISPKKWLQNCQRLLELEREYGVGAYYFILSGPYGMRRQSSRCDSHWRSSRRMLNLITQAGMTVGLHGSYYAREEDTYLAEKERLEQVLAAPVTTHRNHYLRFDPLRMWSQLEEAGIQYDFSVGFNFHIGFRAGCARAYRGFDFSRGQPSSVISIPMLFMDAILFDGDRQDILRRLRLALEEAKRVDGCVSLLFHPDMFMIDPQFFQILDELLATCRELGADLSGRLPELPAVSTSNASP